LSPPPSHHVDVPRTDERARDCSERETDRVPVMYELQRQNNLLIVDLGTDLVWAVYERASEVENLLQMIATTPEITGVVVDFHRNRSYGTGVLQMLARMWKMLRRRGGRLALCRVSDSGKWQFRRTRLDCIWTLHASLEEALTAVDAGTAPRAPHRPV